VATFRLLTYVVAQEGGLRVSVTAVRSDVEHSTPLTDGESGEAPDRAAARLLRAELVEKVSAKIRARGDVVGSVYEIGDFDRQSK
jgi:hypothetical protein